MSESKTKKKVVPNHPPAMDMIKAALKGSTEKKGMSLMLIKKFVQQQYSVNIDKYAPFLRRALSHGVDKGLLVRVGNKGKGASGSFKLPSHKDAKKDDAAPAAIKTGVRTVKKVGVKKVVKKVAKKEDGKTEVKAKKEVLKKVLKPKASSPKKLKADAAKAKVMKAKKTLKPKAVKTKLPKSPKKAVKRGVGKPKK